jgi:dienelactone hydrolase
MVVVLVALSVSAVGCKKKDDGGQETMETAKPSNDKPADDKPAEPAKPGTADDSVVGEEITYEGGGVKMKGYLAYDKSIEGKRPGVLVVHEWWGHNDYARNRAKQLAKLGYTALAVDMYGDGKQAAHPDDAKKFMMEVVGNMDSAKNRFEAAMELLEKHETVDPDKLAAIGYCFGGGVVLAMARLGVDLDGVASFHGTLGTETPAKKGDIKAKILVAHGNADPFVPAEQVEAFKKEMEAAGADMKFFGYDGAKHAFTNPAATDNGKKFDLPLEYNEEADKKSWAELEKFLKEIFSK